MGEALLGMRVRMASVHVHHQGVLEASRTHDAYQGGEREGLRTVCTQRPVRTQDVQPLG